MNALLMALTMSLTGAEGTFEGPGRLSADLAPFPLQMSLFGGEAAAEAPVVDLGSRSSTSLCLAFELPSYAELLDVKNLVSPMSFDGQFSRPWMPVPSVQAEESMAWMTNWEQR